MDHMRREEALGEVAASLGRLSPCAGVPTTQTMRLQVSAQLGTLELQCLAVDGLGRHASPQERTCCGFLTAVWKPQDLL